MPRRPYAELKIKDYEWRAANKATYNLCCSKWRWRQMAEKESTDYTAYAARLRRISATYFTSD